MSSEPKQNLANVRVTRIAIEPKRAPKGGYLFRGLELAGSVDEPRSFLICPENMSDFSRSDLFGFPLLCWDGALISTDSLHYSNSLDDGSRMFTVTPESRLVLEPHRPVSVTEAVEASICPRSVELRHRVPPEEPFWMAKGRMIHMLLEYLVIREAAGGEPFFDDAYEAALPVIEAVIPGSSVAPRDQALREEAKTHFENIKSWLAEAGTDGHFAELESDRICRTWGLKGRADALFYAPGLRSILELKSGRVPVQDHLLQLLSYSMLLGPEDQEVKWDGQVLYSPTGRTKPLSDTDERWRFRILDGRNRVVSLKHSYGLDPEVRRDSTNDASCRRTGKCFSRRTCRTYFGDLQGTSEPQFRGAEREYYDRWFHLLSLELDSIEKEFARVLDPSTLSERIADGTTVPVDGLTVLPPSAEVSEAEGALHAKQNTGNVTVDLSDREAVVEISSGEELILHRGDAASHDAFRARVVASDNHRISLRIRPPLPLPASKLADWPYPRTMNETDGWFLERVPFTGAQETARRTLYGFLNNADAKIIRAVVNGEAEESTSPASEETDAKPKAAGDSNPASPRTRQSSDRIDAPEDLLFAEGLTEELNEDQESAIRSALKTDSYHIVHGPPGTGKTRVLARLIRLCLDLGERVLVSCPTNVALDRVLVCLMDLGVRDLLRIGKRSSASTEFQSRLPNSGNPPVFLEDLSSMKLGLAGFRNRVNEASLIGATAYQTAAHPLFLKQRFDRVVVDEAGQLDEPSTLGPLALGKRFVLGGDHLQLPPIVKRRPDARASTGATGLAQSLFERLVLSVPRSRISRLRLQYRMSLEVQEIPSRLFYDGTLVPAPDVARRRLKIDPNLTDDERINRIVDPNLPVVFADVDGSESGQASPEEAATAARIAETLIACGVPAGEIGIITPYRAQQALIRRYLGERNLDARSISVDTVDRFQGGEREIILLSLSRSDSVTSFLADRKRLNVSLSRARSKLILLGHAAALEGHPLFSSLLEGLERIRVSV